jgi:hypothetical protein
VPAGQGDIDLVKIFGILRDSPSDVALNLEVITARAPREIDFLSPAAEFWDYYPELLASDFAHFLGYVQSGDERPFAQFEIPTSLTGPEEDEMPAFRVQQLQHVDQSIDWLIKTWGTQNV